MMKREEIETAIEEMSERLREAVSDTDTSPIYIVNTTNAIMGLRKLLRSLEGDERKARNIAIHEAEAPKRAACVGCHGTGVVEIKPMGQPPRSVPCRRCSPVADSGFASNQPNGAD